MTARFTVESWAPEFGSPFDADTQQDTHKPQVDVAVEMAPAAWQPIPVRTDRARTAMFVDGVRRLDARVWVEEPDGVKLAICASYAAGAVRCNGAAEVVSARVERRVVGPPSLDGIATNAGTFAPIHLVTDTLPDLVNEIQRALQGLEGAVTEALEPAPILIVDGSLTGRENVPNAVGYLKSHQVVYLEGAPGQVVAQLAPGERTPIFLVQTSWSRYSWYLRLPGGQGHPWSGIVRCEAAAYLSPAEAIHLADLAAATIPAFASHEYKDPRAPQNLYPVAGLERELKRRLGDPGLVYRALRLASHRTA